MYRWSDLGQRMGNIQSWYLGRAGGSASFRAIPRFGATSPRCHMVQPQEAAEHADQRGQDLLLLCAAPDPLGDQLAFRVPGTHSPKQAEPGMGPLSCFPTNTGPTRQGWSGRIRDPWEEQMALATLC